MDSKLKEIYGKERPFKMPDGYLEQFHDQLMGNLPQTAPVADSSAKVTLMARIKPLLYMAAMFVGMVFMIQGLMYVQQSRFGADELALTEEIYADEADDFMYSSLYDEYVLYSYLTTGDYE